MKKLQATIFCTALLTSTLSQAAVINTDSFGIFNADVGLGKLSNENTIPFSVGGGYQWQICPDLTGGIEGAFMYNGDISQEGVSSSSYILTPLLSLYYYPGQQFNLFGKIGYGYQTNTSTFAGVSSSSSDWVPVGIVGAGYVIPFSRSVYANLFTDFTWVDESSTNNTITFTGNQLTQNVQFKVGIQLMF